MKWFIISCLYGHTCPTFCNNFCFVFYLFVHCCVNLLLSFIFPVLNETVVFKMQHYVAQSTCFFNVACVYNFFYFFLIINGFSFMLQATSSCLAIESCWLIARNQWMVAFLMMLLQLLLLLLLLFFLLFPKFATKFKQKLY